MLAVFSCTLKFLVRDCDPDSHVEDDGPGYDDEYQVEDLDLNVGDYILPSSVSQFEQTFSQNGNEIIETYVLPCNSIQQCVTLICSQLGLQTTDRIIPQGPTGHVSLAGIFVGGVTVLAKCRMVHDTTGVTLEICVRSGNSIISQKVVDGIQ
jgi:coatomer protein complex subunit gamma